MNFCLLYSCPVSENGSVVIVPGQTRNCGFISGKGKLFYLAQGVHAGTRLHQEIQLAPSPEVRRPYPEARPLLCRSGFFTWPKASITGPRLHHLIQLAPSPEVRRPYPEVTPLLLCRSGVKNAWNCTSAPPCALMT